MLLNGAAIQAAATGFRALYKAGFEQAQPLYPELVVEISSEGHAETYDVILGLPQVREWVGERQVKNMKVWDYSLTNRTWELTIGVKRELFEDDRLGIIKPQFQNMGMQMALHPDTLLGQLFSNAFTTGLCYDGKAFIATNHPIVGGTVSNKVTGALTSDNFAAAIKLLREMKDYEGNPIDVLGMGGKLMLVVGPALEATARALLLAQQGASGASNTDYQRAMLKVFNRITGNAWFLMVVGAPMKPFILQMRRRPEVVARDQVSDDNVFNDNEVRYGADGRWEMGYGLYQLAVGSTGA